MLGGQVRIWTDCAGVLAKVKFYQTTGQFVKANQQHADLWGPLVSMLSQIGDRITFHKVVSHIDPSGGTSEVEQWAFWHNGLVDQAASAMNTRRSDAFMRIWQTCCRVVISQRRIALEIAKHIVRVGKRAHEGKTRPVVTDEALAREKKYGAKRNDVQVPAVVSIARSYELKYGAVFSQTFVAVVVAYGECISQTRMQPQMDILHTTFL